MGQAEKSMVNVQEWTRRICEEEMPVFSHTARSIAAASSDDETSIANLAHLVLRDSTMTTRVLKLANSALFNPSGQPINTISRAIVLLGFDTVKSMALSVALLEPLLKGVQYDRALEEMAHSFHAAVQARNIAQLRGSKEPEAVFVAALLTRLGKMAFWCFPYGKADELDEAYQTTEDHDRAEINVLGFALKELSTSLNEVWGLSNLLTEYLSAKTSASKAVQDLDFANKLIQSVSDGWGGIKINECIKKISQHTGLNIEETREQVQRCAFEAASTAREYGAEATVKYISLPVGGDHEGVDDAPEEHAADYSLQIEIIRELTTMLHEKAELNAILGMISEGIYRVLGMERTVIAFINPGDNILRAKYTIGDEKDRLRDCFAISMNETNLFTHMLKASDSFWLNEKTQKNVQQYLTPQIKDCLDVIEFFAMPIRVNGHGRGLIYADCKRTGRKLTNDEFRVFTHFSEYASIAFDLLANQVKRKSC